MNPTSLLRGFDDELQTYFEKEIERQNSSLSFIPDENSTSPLCAAIMGSVLINALTSPSLNRAEHLESITQRRLCELFGAEHANIKTLNIEAASRVVFHALTQRGDVVMSLDMRKREHCNSPDLSFRFVNFGVDPITQTLDLDALERQAVQCKPNLIILSPVNYPLNIDYERIFKIARNVGALVWCDMSQTAGLVAGGAAITSPVPYADVVTFRAHGAMQGPQSCVILCRKEYAAALDREMYVSGHKGLLTAQLAALSARVREMQDQTYRDYIKQVVDNARALAEGLKRGGLNLICGGTDSHLVMIQTGGISARGAQELLSDSGIQVRICDMLTSNPLVKYEAVRFSSLPATTRGVSTAQMGDLGESIARYLKNPDDANARGLQELVALITGGLPVFSQRWINKALLDNLPSTAWQVHPLS
ncbi:MAG: hypothetical protein IJ228_03485 [Succinivibrio sp.]|nr:hypothetical protein [Succinivibrio sp.]